MGISNRLKSVKTWLGLLCPGVRSSLLPALTAKIRQTILHSNTGIMVVVVVAGDAAETADATAALLSGKFRFFQQQSFHIREDKTLVERTGAVDVSDVALAIDQKNAQNMIKRTLRVGRVLPLVDGLAIDVEDGLQLRARFRRDKEPVTTWFFITQAFRVTGQALRRVVFRIKTQTDKTQILYQGVVIFARAIELA